LRLLSEDEDDDELPRLLLPDEEEPERCGAERTCPLLLPELLPDELRFGAW
jgi:hypothetical protein